MPDIKVFKKLGGVASSGSSMLISNANSIENILLAIGYETTMVDSDGFREH